MAKPKESFDPIAAPGEQTPQATTQPQQGNEQTPQATTPEKVTTITNEGLKETVISPIGQKLVKVEIQYPKDYKGKRFYKNGDTPTVSVESAAIMKEQGILK